MHSEIIQATLILLVLAVAAVVLFRRFNQPAILGYLFIGILAGPYVLDWLHHDEVTGLLGEFGVVFLLFTIGLEFSIPEFIRMRYTLIGLGGAQVLIGTLSGMLIAMSIGFDWRAALVMGGALSLSSTAIVIKQLSEQVELQQQHGRLAVSILLFQDIAAIPFLVMIPIFAQADVGNISWMLFIALAKGVLAFVLLILSGHWLVRPLFHEVASARSAELFTLAVLLVSLTAAWLTSLLGLSLALGAFIAGMMLGDTQYRHQIEAEIRPFRDILLGLFFITIGTQLHVAELVTIWPWVILLVCGLVIGKGMIVAILIRLAGYARPIAQRTGLVLGQGGEFGIALIALSLSTGLINNTQSQPILAAIILSMAIAPLLIRYGERWLRHQQSNVKQQRLDNSDEHQAVTDLHGHIILCGFGRTGENLQRFLRQKKLACVAVDNDPELIHSKRQQDKLVFYGDGRDIKLLESMGIQHAAALIITFDSLSHAKKIISALRASAYDLPIIARAHDQQELNILMQAGATEVVAEDIETSLMLLTQLSLIMGEPVDDVLSDLHEIKQNYYKLLND